MERREKGEKNSPEAHGLPQVNEFTLSPTPVPLDRSLGAWLSTQGFVWMAPKWKHKFGAVPSCQPNA